MSRGGLYERFHCNGKRIKSEFYYKILCPDNFLQYCTMYGYFFPSAAVCEYGAALEGYMEAAALTSSHFHHEVPDSVWSQVTLRQLVKCCCRLGYFTQAVLLTQLLRPVDYELAFRIMKENAGHMTEGMFRYFWDMTIIEYLIRILSPAGDFSL